MSRKNRDRGIIQGKAPGDFAPTDERHEVSQHAEPEEIFADDEPEATPPEQELAQDQLEEQLGLETSEAAAEAAQAPAAPPPTAAPAAPPEASGSPASAPAGDAAAPPPPAPAAPRRLRGDLVIRVLRGDCPKRPGTIAAEHWGYYRDGQTVESYLDDRRMDRRRARANVDFDARHGFVALVEPEAEEAA